MSSALKSFYLTKRQRYDDLKAQLDADFNFFKPQYQELNDFYLPTRGRFVLSSDSNRGDKRNGKIIDPTGYLAARTLAAGMQAGMTSPARPWFRLSTPDPDLAEFGPVREWLEVVEQRMRTYFARSNLYNILPISYGDLGVFGTAAIFMDKDMDTVANYMSFPLGSYRIAKNYRGQVNVFFREFRMTVRQLIDHFGKNDEQTGKPNWAVFSPSVRQLYERGQYEQWVEVCHVIEPNQDYRPSNPHQKFKRFSSCYFEKNYRESSFESEVFLRESGYDYFPVLVPRWQVTGMDAYGTDCPGMISLGDNKELQHGERRSAQAIDKMVNPALKGHSDLKKSKVSLLSGDITYMDDVQHGLSAVHEVNINMSHLDERQERLRDRIDKAFFTNMFLPIINDDRNQRATAAEIKQIGEERLLAIGPVLEQIHQDGLDPLVDNKFFLLNEAGLIPPAPEDIQGEDLKVEYIYVMAQAQKLAGIGSLDRFLQVVTSVSAVDPSALHKFDSHEYLDQYGDNLGVSVKIVRSDEKVKEIMDAAAKQQQAQNALGAVDTLSNAAKNLSQADLSGDSALSALMDQSKAGQLVQQ